MSVGDITNVLPAAAGDLGLYLVNGGNGRFIASSYTLGARVSDDDGVTWRFITTPAPLRTGAYAAGVWVCTTDSGSVVRSTDEGATWVSAGMSAGAVVWAGGYFYSSPVGVDGVMYSADGVTWVFLSLPVGGGASVAGLGTGLATSGNDVLALRQGSVASLPIGRRAYQALYRVSGPAGTLLTSGHAFTEDWVGIGCVGALLRSDPYAAFTTGYLLSERGLETFACSAPPRATIRNGVGILYVPPPTNLTYTLQAGTWVDRGSIITDLRYVAVGVDGNLYSIQNTMAGLFVSYDGGVTFSTISMQPTSRPEVSAGASCILYVASNGVLRLEVEVPLPPEPEPFWTRNVQSVELLS